MTIHFDEDKQNQKLRLLLLDEEEKSTQIVAEELHLPYIDLTRIPINTDGLRLIPEVEARESQLAVFEIVGKKVSIAVKNPTSPETSSAVASLKDKGYEVFVYMTSMQSLKKAWDRYKDLSFAFETEAGSLDISNDEIETLIEKTQKLDDISTLIKEALSIKK
ncbi:MAG: type pilus assembly ATPase PilB, type pilus assembly protein PilB, partial [Candidatus Parcubacteria bacterium]